VTRSDGPAEVVVALSSGVTLRGLIASDELDRMGIAEGETACAIFPASGVIIVVDN
jgi:molybdate transport system regulatory protein